MPLIAGECIQACGWSSKVGQRMEKALPNLSQLHFAYLLTYMYIYLIVVLSLSFSELCFHCTVQQRVHNSASDRMDVSWTYPIVFGIEAYYQSYSQLTYVAQLRATAYQQLHLVSIILQLFDAATLNPMKTYKTSRPVNSAAISPSGVHVSTAVIVTEAITKPLS